MFLHLKILKEKFDELSEEVNQKGVVIVAKEYYMAGRYALTMRAEADRCSEILERFFASECIPKETLLKARGLVILRAVRAGYIILGGQLAWGLALARLPDDRWSAPSCVGIFNAGMGFQHGTRISNIVIVLMEDEAVQAFCQDKTLPFCRSMSIAWSKRVVGNTLSIPVESDEIPRMIVYSQEISGFFAGMSLDQATLIEREEENQAAYGRPISAREILEGQVTPPEGTSKLYELLHAAEESGNAREHAGSNPVAGTGDLNAEQRDSSDPPPL